jgi:hypothetical protein
LKIREEVNFDTARDLGNIDDSFMNENNTNICSEFSVIFRICSEFSAIFRIFRICSEFSAMFRICSESFQNFE